MVENVPEGEHVSHKHFFVRGVMFDILLQPWRRGQLLREVPQLPFDIETIRIGDNLQETTVLVCPMDHALLESAAHDNNRIRRGPYGHDQIVREVSLQCAAVCQFAPDCLENLVRGLVVHVRVAEAVLGGANPKDAVP
jgi:hypothetical protein